MTFQVCKFLLETLNTNHSFLVLSRWQHHQDYWARTPLTWHRGFLQHTEREVEKQNSEVRVEKPTLNPCFPEKAGEREDINEIKAENLIFYHRALKPHLVQHPPTTLRMKKWNGYSSLWHHWRQRKDKSSFPSQHQLPFQQPAQHSRRSLDNQHSCKTFSAFSKD